MLSYELAYKDDTRVDYSYFIEGDRSKCGLVSFSFETGEPSIVKQAQDDRFNRYAFHLMSRLQEFFENGTFRKTGIVAWH